MAYSVTEQLIQFNRSGKELKPSGIVVHSTDNPGASAQDHFNYFNNSDRKSSAHYVIDWNEIVRLIPENEQAWHAGPTANRNFLSVEMCEPKGLNYDEFQEVLKRTVWLVANACVHYAWKIGPAIWSHRGISNMWKETNHVDPHPFLERYGWTWNMFLLEVADKINKLNSEAGTEDKCASLPSLIVFFGEAEERIISYLQEEIKAPSIRLGFASLQLVNAFEKIYGVGGKESDYVVEGQKIKLHKHYTGSGRKQTAAAVIQAVIGGEV